MLRKTWNESVGHWKLNPLCKHSIGLHGIAWNLARVLPFWGNSGWKPWMWSIRKPKNQTNRLTGQALTWKELQTDLILHILNLGLLWAQQSSEGTQKIMRPSDKTEFKEPCHDCDKEVHTVHSYEHSFTSLWIKRKKKDKMMKYTPTKLNKPSCSLLAETRYVC